MTFHNGKLTERRASGMLWAVLLVMLLRFTMAGQGMSDTDPFAPIACARLATIRLEEAGVSTRCIVVSAGDLVTWVNPLGRPITIQAGDDQFFTEDLATALSQVDVPAQGSATVRVIHAGRIDYAASDRPEVSGTILVLGHEAA